MRLLSSVWFLLSDILGSVAESLEDLGTASYPDLSDNDEKVLRIQLLLGESQKKFAKAEGDVAVHLLNSIIDIVWEEE